MAAQLFFVWLKQISDQWRKMYCEGVMELLGNQSFPFSFAFKTSSLVTNAIRKMSKNYPKNTLFPKLLHFERTIIVTGWPGLWCLSTESAARVKRYRWRFLLNHFIYTAVKLAYQMYAKKQKLIFFWVKVSEAQPDELASLLWARGLGEVLFKTLQQAWNENVQTFNSWRPVRRDSHHYKCSMWSNVFFTPKR